MGIFSTLAVGTGTATIHYQPGLKYYLHQYTFSVLDLRLEGSSEKRIPFQAIDWIVLPHGQSIKEQLMLRYAKQLSGITDIEKMTINVLSTGCHELV